MAVTVEEARAFTEDEREFLYQMERRVDLYIRTNGLAVNQNTITYKLEGIDKQGLSPKTMDEMIKRYNDAGWVASFTIAGNSNNPQDFVLVDPNG